jgi:hypothetical protein
MRISDWAYLTVRGFLKIRNSRQGPLSSVDFFLETRSILSLR